jgi:hypothetical protein
MPQVIAAVTGLQVKKIIVIKQQIIQSITHPCPSPGGDLL